MSLGLRDPSLHQPKVKERKKRFRPPAGIPKAAFSPMLGSWDFVMPKPAVKKAHPTRHTRDKGKA